MSRPAELKTDSQKHNFHSTAQTSTGFEIQILNSSLLILMSYNREGEVPLPACCQRQLCLGSSQFQGKHTKGKHGGICHVQSRPGAVGQAAIRSS